MTHPWRAVPSDVLIHRCDLDDASGWWSAEDRVILIDRRLGQAAGRSTIAHESLHAERGDEAGCTPWHDRKQERLVDRLAARRLITLDALADALLWAQDEHELADELWVDVETVRGRLHSLTQEEKDYIDGRIRAAESRMP